MNKFETLVHRLACPDAGETLTLADYREIAKSVISHMSDAERILYETRNLPIAQARAIMRMACNSYNRSEIHLYTFDDGSVIKWDSSQPIPILVTP